MNRLSNDVWFGLRQLRRAPGFTLTAVFTLALGIGASSAIFCLMDGLWLHPMHVPQAGRIARVFATTQQDQEGLFSYFEYQTLAQRVTAFQGKSAGVVAMGGRGSLMPRPDGTSLLLLTNVVSSNFFEVMGVQPLLGRLFTGQDAAQLRAHPGVVLGYHAWQKNFGGDAQIVGRQIALRHGKDEVYQVDVWGVLPPTFRDIDPDSDRDLWMPTETWAAGVGGSDLTSHGARWFNVLGRLAPGASVDQANGQVAAVAKGLELSERETNHDRGARTISDFSYRMKRAGTSGMVLFAIVGGVVLLCAVNVAHLLLARSLSRASEVALRMSLGATRWAVARQLLVENLLLGLLGWAAGLAVAAGIAAALPRLLVSEPAMLVSFSPGQHFSLDWRVFLFAGLLALVTMLLLALVPLLQVSRPQLVPAGQGGALARVTGRTSVLRKSAVWLQIGVSFALLVSTGALVRSFLNTRTRPIGLTRDQMLVLFTQDPDNPIRQTVMADLRALPGVRNVAYAIRSPLMLSEGGIAVKALLPNHPELRDPIEIKFNAVSSGFMDVTGTRVLRGRGFTQADDEDGPVSIIINQTMAQKYWAGQDAIGQVVRLADGHVDARVIGIAEDAPINQLGEMPEPFLYVPFQQYQTHLSNMGELTFVAATGPNAMSMAQDARQVLIHVNPLLDPMMVTSMPELIRYSAGNYRMMAELVSALGAIGLTLTIVGLYGFLAFRVTQRRREIGIRMALGASREATAWLVLRDTARLAAIGLGLGTVFSLGATRLESSVLFGVKPLDAFSMAAALGILTLASAAAAWLPARRAASIQPMQALRDE
ncbi:MAG TPA: ADOP family duplicated permease [Terracidiphilus sp.]|jgi:predicted permease